MKIIRNRLIPPPGFSYINICGVLFTRRKNPITPIEERHESIHTRQMQETLYIFFYLWYLIEWLIKLAIIRDTRKAYRAISFEREAYLFQAIPNYLEERKHYCWLKLL